MIISCEKCEKKFHVDSKLIPKEGRLLLCSSCNHQWFYTFIEQADKSVIPKSTNISKSTKLKKIPKKAFKGFLKNTTNKTNQKRKDTSKNKYFDADEISQSKKNITFLNFIFVFIISSIALLILFETFNETIVYYFPNLDSIVENLYETVIDIFLFIKDLFK